MTGIAELNALPVPDFAAALAGVYEHAPWVAEATAALRPFANSKTLLAALSEAVRLAGEARQLELIRNHPDLAGKAALAGDVTAESMVEQSGAGLDRLSVAEFEAFQRLNAAYAARFGHPFIICVRRHTKDSILQQFEHRLAHEPAAERQAALAEIDRIAALRLNELLGGLDVTGRLSTHVLDTHAGTPATDMALELVELAAQGEDRVLVRARTNADGRTDGALIDGRPVPIGRYELRFRVADYYRARGVALAEPPFLDIVPLRFAVAEPEQNYHVPLLVTPWSYSTYRGS